MKNFNEMWIRPGSSNVEKDSVKKHINSLPHKEAIRIAKQSKLGALPYNEMVINETPIG